MRICLSLVLLTLTGLSACTKPATPPPGDNANEKQKAAGIIADPIDTAPTPKPTPGLPGTAHNKSEPFAALEVRFDSPLLVGTRINVLPGAQIPLTITLCNHGAQPLDPLLVQLETGSFASQLEPTYEHFHALDAPLEPAQDDCAAHLQTLTMTLKATSTVAPGTAVSVSPVLVVQLDREYETFECPFKIEVRPKQPPTSGEVGEN